MFRFPSPRLLWWWVGRSGKKKKKKRKNTWVPEKAGLLSKKAWLQSKLENVVFSFVIPYQMSKQSLNNVVSMFIRDKDIIYLSLLIKQDRVLVNWSTCFFNKWIWNFFFFFTFRKKWVGRAMGNETFYWDGLSWWDPRSVSTGSHLPI